MAVLVTNILQKTYRRLGQMEVTTATGGGTTTAIDTKLADRYGDDDLVDGTLFVIRDAGGANALPEGQFARISGYAESTNTITVDTAITAVAAGDTIGICKPTYPLWLMLEVLNDALAALGELILPDTTNFTFIANQKEYTWPVAEMRRRPARIQVQDSANSDAGWRDVYDWDAVPAAPGATGLITFRTSYLSGQTARVFYYSEHPRVNAYNDVISETVHTELITALTTEKALQWQNDRTAGTDEYLLQRLNKAMADSEQARQLYARWTMPKQTRILTPGLSSRYPGDRSAILP